MMQLYVKLPYDQQCSVGFFMKTYDYRPFTVP